MELRKGRSAAGRWFAFLLVLMFSGILHAGTHHYYYTDPQGTVLAKTDAQGNIIATYDYAPYGQAVASMSGSPNGPGYTAHVNDPETGLVYMQARYYEPAVGRFLSGDPVGPAPENTFSFNRYDYANNNPVKNIDPDGRNITEALGGLLYETGTFVTGNGFHGSQVVGALKDGYNGEGGGVANAALQDANTIAIATGVAGISKGGATLIVSRFAAKEAVEEGAGLAGEAAKKGLGSRFKDKMAKEIDEMFTKKGFTKSGPDPAGGTGGYVNPKTGRSYHIDPKEWGKYREPNHVYVNRPRGYKGPLDKKKLPYRED
jgi:RHS repeat-associated protein